MNISDILTSGGGEKHFSFEVLPPLKGTGTERLFSTIEKFRDFDPAYINITTHHSEFVYRELDNGQYERLRVRRRPGTVAIAAAIQNKFGVPVIPHIICSGATADAIEYELIDLQFLGIENVLLLRGDKARDDSQFVPTPGGHAHTTDLIEQVNRFNDGFFNDGTPIKNPGKKFHYGVACYPEKHDILTTPLRPKLALWRFYELNFRFYILKIHLKNTKFDGFHSESGTFAQRKYI